MASRVSTFFGQKPKATSKTVRLRHRFCGASREVPVTPGESYFCFTAIAEISMRALLTKAAAWIVARAGLGSGTTPL